LYTPLPRATSSVNDFARTAPGASVPSLTGNDAAGKPSFGGAFVRSAGTTVRESNCRFAADAFDGFVNVTVTVTLAVFAPAAPAELGTVIFDGDADTEAFTDGAAARVAVTPNVLVIPEEVSVTIHCPVNDVPSADIVAASLIENSLETKVSVAVSPDAVPPDTGVTLPSSAVIVPVIVLPL
jgi:hypothetical protein